MAQSTNTWAPSSLADRLPGVPTGGISYGSNQLRVHLPRDAAGAWQTTRAIVERLATRLETSAA
jgi:hypothetical protein